MKKAISNQKSAAKRKVQLAAAAAQSADKLAAAAKEKAHQAKVKIKTAKKVFKQAKKAAKKAAKLARRAQKELKACLDKVATKGKTSPAKTRKPVAARKKSPRKAIRPPIRPEEFPLSPTSELAATPATPPVV